MTSENSANTPAPQEQPKPLVVGERLPGLLNGGELPDGLNYWDLVIQSTFGSLKYDPFIQMRDGYIRWTSEDGHTVTVESSTGIISRISNPTPKE